eukprot:Pgem_evm1s2899
MKFNNNFGSFLVATCVGLVVAENRCSTFDCGNGLCLESGHGLACVCEIGFTGDDCKTEGTQIDSQFSMTVTDSQFQNLNIEQQAVYAEEVKWDVLDANESLKENQIKAVLVSAKNENKVELKIVLSTPQDSKPGKIIQEIREQYSMLTADGKFHQSEKTLHNHAIDQNPFPQKGQPQGAKSIEEQNREQQAALKGEAILMNNGPIGKQGNPNDLQTNPFIYNAHASQLAESIEELAKDDADKLKAKKEHEEREANIDHNPFPYQQNLNEVAKSIEEKVREQSEEAKKEQERHAAREHNKKLQKEMEKFHSGKVHAELAQEKASQTLEARKHVKAKRRLKELIQAHRESDSD